jgi:signal transduction histidine kinase
MFRLSSKSAVILAGLCFVGLVLLQVVWMESAYEGELALYEKARKQFESGLQADLSQDEQLKSGLKGILESYGQRQHLDDGQTEWFYSIFVPTILTHMNSQLGVYTVGTSIIQERQVDSSKPVIATVISDRYEAPTSLQLEKAGKLCIECILGLKKELHDHNSYQLVLFYRDYKADIVEKLALLMVCSLVLLIILGFLFRQVIIRYSVEKKLSESKNDFINNLSHEMQTPVFAIQLANKLISEKMSEEWEIRPFTQVIEKEAKQLKEHAAKILELASLENGQIELNKELTELNSFVAQKQQTIELMMKGRGGELTLKLHPSGLYCELDPVHFNNVLVSISDNAIKYSKGAPKLIIETGSTDKNVYLKFTDSGIGIRNEYLPYIAEKFFRVPDVKRNGVTGFGLGLSYVKQIVDLHGAEINFASEEGVGTIITISLPKAETNA